MSSPYLVRWSFLLTSHPASREDPFRPIRRLTSSVAGRMLCFRSAVGVRRRTAADHLSGNLVVLPLGIPARKAHAQVGKSVSDDGLPVVGGTEHLFHRHGDQVPLLFGKRLISIAVGPLAIEIALSVHPSDATGLSLNRPQSSFCVPVMNDRDVIAEIWLVPDRRTESDPPGSESFRAGDQDGAWFQIFGSHPATAFLMIIPETFAAAIPASQAAPLRPYWETRFAASCLTMFLPTSLMKAWPALTCFGFSRPCWVSKFSRVTRVWSSALVRDLVPC